MKTKSNKKTNFLGFNNSKKNNSCNNSISSKNKNSNKFDTDTKEYIESIDIQNIKDVKTCNNLRIDESTLNTNENNDIIKQKQIPNIKNNISNLFFENKKYDVCYFTKDVEMDEEYLNNKESDDGDNSCHDV